METEETEEDADEDDEQEDAEVESCEEAIEGKLFLKISVNYLLSIFVFQG